MAGIEGRLARRGARLVSGGCLVGAVLLFSRRCVVFAAFVRLRVVRACVVVGASRAGSSGRVASVVPGLLVLAGCLRPRLVFRPCAGRGAWRGSFWWVGPGWGFGPLACSGDDFRF